MIEKYLGWLLVLNLSFLPTKGSAFWPFDSDQELFAQGCEAVLLERLVSPSSYRRIEITEISRTEGDLNDYLGLVSPRMVAERAQRVASDPKYAELNERRINLFATKNFQRVSIMITYDASNRLGAIVRGSAECSEYIERDTDWSDQSVKSPRVDGLSALQWSVEQLQE